MDMPVNGAFCFEDSIIINKQKRIIAKLQSALSAMTAERDEARDWVRRMHNDRQTLTCAFCGQAYPPGTAASSDDALRDHIAVCQKHPMRKVEAERDAAEQRAAVMAAALRSDRFDAAISILCGEGNGYTADRLQAVVDKALSSTGAKVERGFAHQSHRNPGVWILAPERTTADGGQTWSRPAMLVTFEETP